MKHLLIVIVVVAFTGFGCHVKMAGVKGSGKRGVQKRDVQAFTSISTEGAYNINVVCQKAQAIEVEGDDNILPLITTDVSNNVLHVKSLQNYSTDQPVELRISVPNLAGLSVSGAGNIDVAGLKGDKFLIDSNGAPQIKASGTAKEIYIHTSGAGKIDTHSLHAS